ncbi:hypothetical protein F5148DRAFT_1293381 [Russula earlei]|uniref:Uncharacterized protein n=1 Tax=Russula earlei TaxID=71964 RepID=A0ACC0TSL6_9AGAM|nr:hypothetical protein F5148DRAFT_1293381 [Russula earlei]
MSIITLASYASAAVSAATDNNNPTKPNPRHWNTPTITEVTVLQAGRHDNEQLEQLIHARAADVIVRDICLQMSKVVARPIPLQAGNISFDHIMSYKPFLLKPFHGIGQLCPSMGWTQFLTHGVLVKDNNGITFGPQALLTEATSLPGLCKAHFSMEPRWLKPIKRINSLYSTLTFAISNPDGSSTLFGKEVKIYMEEGEYHEWIVSIPNHDDEIDMDMALDLEYADPYDCDSAPAIRTQPQPQPLL